MANTIRFKQLNVDEIIKGLVKSGFLRSGDLDTDSFLTANMVIKELTELDVDSNKLENKLISAKVAKTLKETLNKINSAFTSMPNFISNGDGTKFLSDNGTYVTISTNGEIVNIQLANDLTTETPGLKALDAYQGKKIKDDIDKISKKVDELEENSNDYLFSGTITKSVGGFNAGDVIPNDNPLNLHEVISRLLFGYVQPINNGITLKLSDNTEFSGNLKVFRTTDVPQLRINSFSTNVTIKDNNYPNIKDVKLYRNNVLLSEITNNRISIVNVNSTTKKIIINLENLSDYSNINYENPNEAIYYITYSDADTTNTVKTENMKTSNFKIKVEEPSLESYLYYGQLSSTNRNNSAITTFENNITTDDFVNELFISSNSVEENNYIKNRVNIDNISSGSTTFDFTDRSDYITTVGYFLVPVNLIRNIEFTLGSNGFILTTKYLTNNNTFVDYDNHYNTINLLNDAKLFEYQGNTYVCIRTNNLAGGSYSAILKFSK